MTNTNSTPPRGSVVRNAMHLGLGQIATTILTILLSATLARTLGAADFGLLYLLMSIATFAYVFVEWGHNPLIIRETVRNPEKAGNLLGSALALRAASALVACAVAVASTWLLGYDVRTRVLTAVLILAWLPQYLGLSFGSVFRAHSRMDRDALMNVILKLTTLIGSVTCLALGGRLRGLMLAWCLAGCLTLAVGITMYRKLRLPRLSVSLQTARALWHNGASLLAIFLAVAIEPYLNANILYKRAPAAVVGWYGAAWNICGTLLAPATILAATMYPRWSMASGDPAEFKRSFDISFRPLLLVAVLGAVGTYLFADVAIGLIYSRQKFGPAADTLRAFAPVLLLMYVDVFVGMAILASGRAGRLAAAKVGAVVITTTLVFFLVPICQARYGNGGLGVMFAMTLGEVLMLVAAATLIRRALDGRMLVDVCRCLAAGAVTILVMRLLPTLTPILAIPMCIALFAGLALVAGALHRADVELLLSAIKKKGAPLPLAETSEP